MNIKHRRQAFTLIELLVVMTLLGAIFAAVLITLHGLHKSSKSFTNSVAELLQQRRFVGQLREDTHAASAAALVASADTPDAKLLRLTTTPKETIEYRLFADRIERIVTRDQQQVHRETYAVSPILEQGWSMDRSRSCPIVDVALHQPGQQPHEHAGTIPIQIQTSIPMCQLDDLDDTVAGGGD